MVSKQPDTPEQRHLEAAQRQATAAVWACVATWIAAVAALVAVYLAVKQFPKATSEVAKASQGVSRIESAVVNNRFIITSPAEGDHVTIGEVVTGLTPYTNRNHYIIVTPLKVGDSYVQERATVRPDGTWSGPAKFGSGDVGVGERFLVRCAATAGELRTGTMGSQPLPPDLQFSSPVTVTRAQ